MFRLACVDVDAMHEAVRGVTEQGTGSICLCLTEATYTLRSTFVDAFCEVLGFGGGIGALVERFRGVVAVHFDLIVRVLCWTRSYRERYGHLKK